MEHEHTPPRDESAAPMLPPPSLADAASAPLLPPSTPPSPVPPPPTAPPVVDADAADVDPDVASVVDVDAADVESDAGPVVDVDATDVDADVTPVADVDAVDPDPDVAPVVDVDGADVDLDVVPVADVDAVELDSDVVPVVEADAAEVDADVVPVADVDAVELDSDVVPVVEADAVEPDPDVAPVVDVDAVELDPLGVPVVDADAAEADTLGVPVVDDDAAEPDTLGVPVVDDDAAEPDTLGVPVVDAGPTLAPSLPPSNPDLAVPPSREQAPDVDDRMSAPPPEVAPIVGADAEGLVPTLPPSNPGPSLPTPAATPDAAPDPHAPPIVDADAAGLTPAPPFASPSPNGDAPFLPPATPSAPPPAPIVPAGSTETPAPEPAPFDAKAMVESQKHYTPEPTYGAMPSGSPEGRDAARRLREEANRKKRRNKILARVIGVVALVGVGVGGFVGYQAYRDGQDDEVAESDAAEPDATVADGTANTDGADDAGPNTAGADTATPNGSAAAAAGLTPLGVIDEQLQAQDTVDSGTRTGVGGYLDAIDDARAVVDDINERAEDVDDLTGTSVLDDPPAAPAVRLDVVVTRFDLSTPDAPVVQQFVADLTNDTYVAVTGTGDEVFAAAETDDRNYYQYDAVAGTLVSATRGDASLRSGPDGLFVAPLTPDVIYPPEMVLHSTATPVPITTPDGAELLTTGYIVDVAGFTSVQPEAAADWLALVQEADPGRRPSIEAGTVATIDRVPADDLAAIAAEASDELAFPDEVDRSAAPTPTADQAVIGWTVAENGLISHLYVHLGDGSAHWLYQVEDFEALPFSGLLADAEPLG